MRRFPLFLVLAMPLVNSPARGEVPLLTPEELQQQATHIVLGDVQRVYTAEKSLEKNYVNTLFAVEVVVTDVEKGKGVAPDQVIYAKAWRMKTREPGWVGPSGQDVIPKPGQAVKLYLTGERGSYDALSPNGIQILSKK